MTKHILWMIFILIMMSIVASRYQDEQRLKGKALSHYLLSTQGLKVPPEEARWLTVVTTQYNLDFHDVDVFMPDLK